MDSPPRTSTQSVGRFESELGQYLAMAREVGDLVDLGGKKSKKLKNQNHESTRTDMRTIAIAVKRYPVIEIRSEAELIALNLLQNRTHADSRKPSDSRHFTRWSGKVVLAVDNADLRETLKSKAASFNISVEDTDAVNSEV